MEVVGSNPALAKQRIKFLPAAYIETRTDNWDQFPERHVNAKTRAWKSVKRDLSVWAIVYQATEAAEQ